MEEKIGLYHEHQKASKLRAVLVIIIGMLIHTLMLSIMGIAGMTIIQLGGGEADKSYVMLLCSILAYLILIPLYIIFLCFSRKKDKRIVLMEKIHLGEFLASISCMIGSLGFINLLLGLMVFFSSFLPFLQHQFDKYSEIANLLGSQDSLVLQVLAVVIGAPIVEELLFRGIIQGELRKVMPEWGAILIQGALFSLIHFNFIQSFYVIIPGLVLGYCYAKTKNLLIPILMHITFNFLGSTLQMLIENKDVFAYISLMFLAFIPVGILCMIYLHLKGKGRVSYDQN